MTTIVLTKTRTFLETASSPDLFKTTWDSTSASTGASTSANTVDSTGDSSDCTPQTQPAEWRGEWRWALDVSTGYFNVAPAVQSQLLALAATAKSLNTAARQDHQLPFRTPSTSASSAEAAAAPSSSSSSSSSSASPALVAPPTAAPTAAPTARVLTAAPNANSFYGARGIIGAGEISHSV